jgi:hypothetical protein
MTTNIVDNARVELLLNELRLPSVRLMWAKLGEQSDKEGWPAARFLAVLAGHEMAVRGRRHFERHLTEARPPAGKTLALRSGNLRALAVTTAARPSMNSGLP